MSLDKVISLNKSDVTGQSDIIEQSDVTGQSDVIGQGDVIRQNMPLLSQNFNFYEWSCSFKTTVSEEVGGHTMKYC